MDSDSWGMFLPGEWPFFFLSSAEIPALPSFHKQQSSNVEGRKPGFQWLRTAIC